MMDLLSLPNEILDSVFGQLDQKHVAQCIRVCKAFQTYLEPHLYREVNLYDDIPVGWVAAEHTGEPEEIPSPAKSSERLVPIGDLVRTIMRRPKVARHIRKVSYSGSSHRLPKRRMLKTNSRSSADAFSGLRKQIAMPTKESLRISLLPIFDMIDLNRYWQINSQLSDLTGNPAIKHVNSIFAQNAAPPDDHAMWPFPQMLYEQGLVLSLLDLLILMSPNLTSLSLSIKMMQRLTKSDVHFRLYSLSFTDLDLDGDTGFSFSSSKLRHLSHFEFAVTEQRLTYPRAYFDSSDITRLLRLPMLEHLKICSVGYRPVRSFEMCQPSPFLQKLTLAATYPISEHLRIWLQLAPKLGSLKYHINLDVDFPEYVHDSYIRLGVALSQVAHSLQHLELYYSTGISTFPGQAIDFPERCPEGVIGSLGHFTRLQSLAISWSILLGQDPKIAPAISSRLPTSLRRLHLIENTDGVGYDWETADIERFYTEFLLSAHETHPHLIYVCLLLADLNADGNGRLLPSMTHPAQLPQDQQTLVSHCAERGIKLVISSSANWENRYHISGGESGFSTSES